MPKYEAEAYIKPGLLCRSKARLPLSGRPVGSIGIAEDVGGSGGYVSLMFPDGNTGGFARFQVAVCRDQAKARALMEQQAAALKQNAPA